MRRSPPAVARLTAIGAQKRPFEELTSEEPPTPEVDGTPEFADVEGENDKPRDGPPKVGKRKKKTC
jgi:hypothetical protein